MNKAKVFKINKDIFFKIVATKHKNNLMLETAQSKFNFLEQRMQVILKSNILDEDDEFRPKRFSRS